MRDSKAGSVTRASRDEIADQDAGVDFEAGQRLVEQDLGGATDAGRVEQHDVGVVQERGAQKHPLPHPLRVGVERRAAVFGQAELLEEQVDARLQALLRHLLQPPDQLQELLTRHPLEERRGLRHVSGPSSPTTSPGRTANEMPCSTSPLP